MLVADLPPSIETVRQALLAQPPAYVTRLEASPSDRDFDRKYEAHKRELSQLAKLSALQILLIRTGIDTLFLRVATGDPEVGLEQIEKLVAAANATLEDGKRLRAEIDGARQRAMAIPAPPATRAKAKRLLDQLYASAETHHDGLVLQYYRLLSLAADLDPTSRERLGTSSSVDETRAIFMDLRSA